MSCTPQNCCDFAGNYDLSRLPQIKKLEQSALGCDYGGTSWPSLLLGKLTACELTLLDIPLNALRQAAERVVADNMDLQVAIVAGSGTSLPFADESFDRISHSDVLCCLPEKLELLQEARRVVGEGALMNFSVILPAEGLSESDLNAVFATGPPFVDLDGRYSELLQESGWALIDCEDVTDEYKASLQRLVDGIHRNEEELVRLLGADDLLSKRLHREDQISLIARGLMRRETYVAMAATMT